MLEVIAEIRHDGSEVVGGERGTIDRIEDALEIGDLACSNVGVSRLTPWRWSDERECWHARHNRGAVRVQVLRDGERLTMQDLAMKALVKKRVELGIRG